MDISGVLVCPSLILFIEFYIVYAKLSLCVPGNIVHFYYYFSGECGSLNENIPHQLRSLDNWSLDLEIWT